MHIAITNKSPHALPAYATEGASGLDLRAHLQSNVVLTPHGGRALVGTGLYIAIPDGFEAQIRPRSGLAFHHLVTVLNAPGTIDSDYRGEISVLLVNLGEHDFLIQDGDRIAQLVVAPYTKITWKPVETLPKTIRDQGGFGSTGRQ